MIVDRKDGKCRVTRLAAGYLWRAEKSKENGELADNRLAVSLNKEQFERWKANEQKD